ncbi:MAG: EAL domain-containing protein [Labilibaculum sp.]|nr:EAL domain-containing protein [Labilibaculum sp.]
MYTKNVKLRYRYQNIFSADSVSEINGGYNAIASELLIDRKLSIHSNAEDLDFVIHFGEAANKTLDYACAYSLSSPLSIFINIERSNLCDVKVIKRICDISKRLELFGTELVVEVTERDFCSKCTKVLEGLTYLKSKEVVLAKDDFDYLTLDFKSINTELALFYEYVKIDVPLNFKEKVIFDDFVEAHYKTKKIIVEKIETKEQLKMLDLIKLWGVQGFLFCKGETISKI